MDSNKLFIELKITKHRDSPSDLLLKEKNSRPHKIEKDKLPSHPPPGDCCCRVQRCILWPCLVSVHQAYTATSILFPGDLVETMTQPKDKIFYFLSQTKSYINVRSSDYILEAWSLMISALDSKSTGPDSSDGRSHCSVFLGDFHMGGLSQGDSYRGGNSTIQEHPIKERSCLK